MRSGIIAAGIIFLSFAVGIYFYPQMPEEMAFHWNAQGQADGYASKFWGLFFLPFFSLASLLLFVLIPKIDPLKANIEKFRKHYDGFVVLIMTFFFYLYLLTILWNVGTRFDMIQLLAPILGILFYYAGILTENAKRNWFIGVRTPWTLSNEKVWEKTNRIGGKLLKTAGIIALLGAFFQGYALFFLLLPVVLVAIYSTVYSYFEYQKQLR